METLLSKIIKENQKVSNAHKPCNNSVYTVGLTTQIEKTMANDKCRCPYYNLYKMTLWNRSLCSMSY